MLALLEARATPDRDEAMLHASTAVELASASSLLQTVSTEGAAIIELVEQAAWHASEEWLDRLRRSTADTGDRRPPIGASLIGTLSEREREVLRLLALGHTNQEIAKLLYISVRTAETHRAHIMRKLDLSSRAELVRYALAEGLLE